MTQEALKLALEELAVRFSEGWHEGIKIDASDIMLLNEAAQALAQPEQEPVGDDWTPCMKLPVVVYVRKQRLGESHVSTREGITPVKPDDLIMRGVSGEEYPIGRAIFEQTYSLNTHPPQREWVGLTDVEIDYLLGSTAGENEETHISFARAIEAKLKELNT